MDPEFADGFCYDDDDFFYRLWQTGLDFIFTDEISGVHLHHERPGLKTLAGQAGIQRNAAYMLKKHGTTHVWPNLPRLTIGRPGETHWLHPK